MTQNRRMETRNEVSHCCTKYGETRLVAYFEKDKYSVGSKAFMIVEIDNSGNKMPIKAINAKLVQSYNFKAETARENKTDIL